MKIVGKEKERRVKEGGKRQKGVNEGTCRFPRKGKLEIRGSCGKSNKLPRDP